MSKIRNIISYFKIKKDALGNAIELGPSRGFTPDNGDLEYIQRICNTVQKESEKIKRMGLDITDAEMYQRVLNILTDEMDEEHGDEYFFRILYILIDWGVLLPS